jgi:nitrite reductase/ring-hydroxylating ferredoxin subunit/Fe-S cluster biogenesis protein NfuA
MNAHAQPPDQDQHFDTLAGDIERLEALISHWDESQRAVVFAYRQAIDALQKAALRKLVAEVKGAPGALEALRQAAADPVVYGVLRYHGLIQPSQQERIERALASVRPMLAAHGGDVELIAFVPPDVVEVRFLGNCDGCSASTLTFVGGVKRAIEEHCPEIKQVRQVKGATHASAQHGFTSPFVETGHWHSAIDLEAIPEAGVARAVIEGEALLFARNSDSVICFNDSCAHLGLPISAGTIADGHITCPHHGFKYDLASGECITAPEVQLRPVPVRMTGTRVEVRLESKPSDGRSQNQLGAK